MTTTTKERPIIFSGEMVPAILDGCKTQTRRVLMPQPEEMWQDCYGPRNGELTIVPYHEGGPRSTWQTCWDDDGRCWMLWTDGSPRRMYVPRCLYGRPGDRLWVRETWAAIWTEYEPREGQTVWDVPHHIEYKADSGARYPGDWQDDCGDDPDCPRWSSPIHMPSPATRSGVCRILLEISNVRVEPVQDISEKDIDAEGTWFPGKRPQNGDPRAGFEMLWNMINEKRGLGWAVNPSVWAIDFKRMQASERSAGSEGRREAT